MRETEWSQASTRSQTKQPIPHRGGKYHVETLMSENFVKTLKKLVDLGEVVFYSHVKFAFSYLKSNMIKFYLKILHSYKMYPPLYKLFENFLKLLHVVSAKLTHNLGFHVMLTRRGYSTTWRSGFVWWMWISVSVIVFPFLFPRKNSERS